jgi:adenine-specific DNA methylase
MQRQGVRNVRIPIRGEWIGERSKGQQRAVTIRCGDATSLDLPPRSLDAVFTDPPYFGNVQYGELMDFCYVWLRRLVGTDAAGFDRPSTREAEELTANVTQARGYEHFTDGIARVHVSPQQARGVLSNRRRYP